MAHIPWPLSQSSCMLHECDHFCSFVLEYTTPAQDSLLEDHVSKDNHHEIMYFYFFMNLCNYLCIDRVTLYVR